jgi:hypothetical protein
MSNSVSTQGQAIKVINALVEVVRNVGGTNAEQVGDVKALFTLVLGSASPAVSASTASKVVDAFRAASLGNSDTPAQTKAFANTIGAALLGSPVSSTTVQAQALFAAVWNAFYAVDDEPGHQVAYANALITALLAL